MILDFKTVMIPKSIHILCQQIFIELNTLSTL